MSQGNVPTNPFLAHAEQQQQQRQQQEASSSTSSQQQQQQHEQRNDAPQAITPSQNMMNANNNAAEVSRPSITATTYTPAPAAGTPIAGPVPSQQDERANNFAVGSPFFSSQLYTGGPSVEYYENDEQEAQRARDEIRNAFSRIGVNAPSSDNANDLLQFVVARQLSRTLRLFACVDIIFCMFFFFTAWVFVFLLFGPVMGYQGARFFKYGNVVAYLVYVLGMACWRVALFIINKSAAAKVLTFIMFIVEIYILRLVFKFMQLLKRFSEEELQLLRILENPQRNVYWHQSGGAQATQSVVIVPPQAGMAGRAPMYH